MQEYDHLLNVRQHGLHVLSDGEAVNNNIEEWLDNPVHTISDRPDWGHNLTPFLFEPPSTDLAVAIEASIAEKLPKDVISVKIDGVRITWPEMGVCLVEVLHQYGKYSKPLRQL